MNFKQALLQVNYEREKRNLPLVYQSSRPGRSHKGETIELFIGDNPNPVRKSASWGPIVAFMHGMLQAFSEKPVPKITIEPVKKMRRLAV